jgi:protease I
MKAAVDIPFDQVKVNDYDAILFIGGPGSFDYYNNSTCHKIAQEAVKEGKILGAICAAPGILAHAGVLAGKKATMFEDTGVLKQFGAEYTGKDVEVDGKIITATGPDTAKAWAERIIKELGS